MARAERSARLWRPRLRRTATLWFWCQPATSINPSIYAKLPYDTEKDFAPITMVASAAILMAVNPSVPADSVRAFVEAAKAKPQAIANYGSAGAGTVFHLTGELFKQLSGLPLQHVPYRS